MKKNYKPEPVIKTTLYQKEDNSVELYSLSRGQIVETYLRRGDSVELVEGDVDLKFKPAPPEHNINIRDLTRLDWSTKGGLSVRKSPKNLLRY